jgi:hypothetical protein
MGERRVSTNLAALALWFLTADVTTPVFDGTGISQQSPGQLRLSETLFLKSGVWLGAGYDSNLLRGRESVGSPVVLLYPQIAISNASSDLPWPPLTYKFEFGAQYRNFTAELPEERRPLASWLPSALASIHYVARKDLTASMSNRLARQEARPAFEGDDIPIALTNEFTSQIRSTLGDYGRLMLLFGYANFVSRFAEPEFAYADEMRHQFSSDAAWKWLPKTAIFARGALTLVRWAPPAPAATASGDNPALFTATAGMRGLLTAKLSGVFSLGYDRMWGGDRGSNASGMGVISWAAEGRFLASSGSLMFGCHRGLEFSSLLENDVVKENASLGASTQVAAFVAQFGAEAALSHVGTATGSPSSVYEGSGSAKVGYYIQRWLVAGLSYTATIVRRRTEGSSAPGGRALPAYDRHQVVASLGASY